MNRAELTNRTEHLMELCDQLKKLETITYYFQTERLHGAGDDFSRLYSEYMERITDMYRWQESFYRYDYQFFMALENMKNYAILLATLACAAGANSSVCRDWYLFIAGICSFEKTNVILPFQYSEMLIYLALAGEFSKERFYEWPSVPTSQATPDLVLYSLMTGNPLNVDRSKCYYDAAIWCRYYDAMLGGDTAGVKAACMDFANYFWNDCEANELPIYSPEEYPCFEPDYNAALAIALYREGMDITFEDEEYEKFYMGALGSN